MIGLALIISFVSIVIALIKKSRFRLQVVFLAIGCVAIFAITYHYANPTCPPNVTCNPFAGIGPAIIGSAIGLIVSLASLILAFRK